MSEPGVGRLRLPPIVDPKPLIRVLADKIGENLVKIGGVDLNVVLEITCPRDVNFRPDVQCMRIKTGADNERWEHRNVIPQGQDGDHGNRAGRFAKKIHENACAASGILIHQNADRFLLF